MYTCQAEGKVETKVLMHLKKIFLITQAHEFCCNHQKKVLTLERLECKIGSTLLLVRLHLEEKFKKFKK
jgi:hypothetical protein